MEGFFSALPFLNYPKMIANCEPTTHRGPRKYRGRQRIVDLKGKQDRHYWRSNCRFCVPRSAQGSALAVSCFQWRLVGPIAKLAKRAGPPAFSCLSLQAHGEVVASAYRNASCLPASNRRRHQPPRCVVGREQRKLHDALSEKPPRCVVGPHHPLSSRFLRW